MSQNNLARSSNIMRENLVCSKGLQQQKKTGEHWLKIGVTKQLGASSTPGLFKASTSNHTYSFQKPFLRLDRTTLLIISAQL